MAINHHLWITKSLSGFKAFPWIFIKVWFPTGARCGRDPFTITCMCLFLQVRVVTTFRIVIVMIVDTNTVTCMCLFLQVRVVTTIITGSGQDFHAHNNNAVVTTIITGSGHDFFMFNTKMVTLTTKMNTKPISVKIFTWVIVIRSGALTMMMMPFTVVMMSGYSNNCDQEWSNHNFYF